MFKTKVLNENRPIIAKMFFLLALLFVLTTWVNSALALFLGVAIALTTGNPFQNQTIKLSQKLLMYSVVGLGAGMNLIKVAAVGLSGLGYTALSIIFTLVLGLALGKFIKVEEETSWLVSFGTAICGGSAIAAMAPVVRAKPQAITVSLGVVFLLNSVALLIFPYLGHLMNFSQEQFGFWAALAIHDTSSVVGASLQYGATALQIGTSVKLARALWIVPSALGVGFFLSRIKKSDDQSKNNIKKPWFILGFIICAGIFTWVPQLSQLGHGIEMTAKKGLVLTLFLIGSNLSLNSLKAVGIKPLLQGFVLWVVVASTTAALIYNSIIAYN